MSLKQSILEQFDKNAASNNALKIKAFDSFNQLDIPTIKDEEWKFTNLSKLAKNSFSNETSVSVQKDDLAPFSIKGYESNELTFVNGVYNEALSSIKDTNFEFGKIEDIPSEYKNTFGSLANSEINGLSAANTALYPNAYFVIVRKGKTVENYISLNYLSKGENTEALIAYPRLLVILEENAEANFFDNTKTAGNAQSLSLKTTEILVQKEARGAYHILQNDNETASEYNHVHIQQKDKSVFTTSTFSLSGEIVRNNLNFELDGEHIESNMYGLYLINGKTHVDNHTVADHKKPNCLSNELYKGVIDDSARGVFNGKIFVRQDAQKTNAFQSNKNLLLSDNATINTKPQLEIWADDVSCSHGCTSGQLDKEALFYMKSRGIGDKQAKALLLQAFAEEVVSYISNESIRDYINNIIENRLIQ